MIKVTGDRGKIAIITYPEVTSCILRRDGFVDYLTKNDSALEVVTELSGKGNRNDGYAVATDILQAHSEIVGIFAINDPSGLGAYAAVTRVAPAHIWSGIRKETPFLWRMAKRKPTSHY